MLPHPGQAMDLHLQQDEPPSLHQEMLGPEDPEPAGIQEVDHGLLGLPQLREEDVVGQVWSR